MGHSLCICSRGTVTIDNKRYLFIQKLGEGGFSYVDLVEGVHDGHFYALKRILCHDEEDRRDALREVEMHRVFQHPNILPLEAHCLLEKGPKWEAWLLLPYLRRGTLWNEVESLRDQNSFMSEERILHIFHGICLGLHAIHSKGYAHRDLKPTNVLLDDNDSPLLMDLGSMNRAQIEVTNSRQALALQSLGCVLFCMMFGEGPYDMIFQKGDSVALAVQSNIPVPKTPRYSESLMMLLSSIMVANPQERPHIPSVLHQLKELQPIAIGQATTRI
ncbi:serine/threonine-protein kinase 16 isoform X2 [Rhinatrema bivittatum]|uniref:serine/threonine-protein kinase 16 isoform X2 n=1 Tax=Rhinatrema bivittatum TaxID=194408 RepID=UPI00112D9080|nr:serine/threonine-protein kinase 16 isoform X2 [Rhinatrema bivittatum]